MFPSCVAIADLDTALYYGPPDDCEEMRWLTLANRFCPARNLGIVGSSLRRTVEAATAVISTVRRGSPTTIVTTAEHTFLDDDLVMVEGVVGLEALDGQVFVVQNANAAGGTFEIAEDTRPTNPVYAPTRRLAHGTDFVNSRRREGGSPLATTDGMGGSLTRVGALIANDQCFAKCSQGGAGCGGYRADQDGVESDALCLPVADCQAICADLDDCAGVDAHNQDDRCWLNSWDCLGPPSVQGSVLARDIFMWNHSASSAANEKYNLLLKIVHVNTDCGGDDGTDVTSIGPGVGGNPFLGRLPAGDVGLVRDGAVQPASNLLEANQCHSFQVQHQVLAVDPTPEPPTPCLDDDFAAAHLLGLTTDATTGASTWTPTTVCADNSEFCTPGTDDDALTWRRLVFGAICPRTCSRTEPECLGDDEEAATAFVTGMDLLGVIGCGDLCLVMGYDPAVRAMCKTTCGKPPEGLGLEALHPGLSYGDAELQIHEHGVRQLEESPCADGQHFANGECVAGPAPCSTIRVRAPSGQAVDFGWWVTKTQYFYDDACASRALPVLVTTSEDTGQRQLLQRSLDAVSEGEISIADWWSTCRDCPQTGEWIELRFASGGFPETCTIQGIRFTEESKRVEVPVETLSSSKTPEAAASPQLGVRADGDIECAEGEVDLGGICFPPPLGCTPVRIRVANGQALDFGWRIRNMQFFYDEDCANPAVPTVTATSNDATQQRFYQHVVDLAVDGNGEAGPNQASYTEWWSDCLECGKDEAWIELQFPAGSSPDTCRIQGMKFIQDQFRRTDRVHVSKQLETNGDGAPALPASVGVRPDPVRSAQQVDTKWTHQFRFFATDPNRCMGLECGFKCAKQLHTEVLLRIPNIPSACLCKQICLDRLSGGCRSWSHYREDDKNWDTTDTFHGVEHSDCYLFTSEFNRSALVAANNLLSQDCTGEDCREVPSSGYHRRLADGSLHYHWLSGGVGTILQGFEPTTVTSGRPFNLRIFGVEMPAHQDGLALQTSGVDSRVKLVLSSDPLRCRGVQPPQVGGTGCIGNVCHPAPTEAGYTINVFSNLAIRGEPSVTRYLVCFCGGPRCSEAWQYTEVPGGTLTVDTDSVWSWSTSPAVVRADSAPVTLAVSRPASSSDMDMFQRSPPTWNVKIVETKQGHGIVAKVVLHGLYNQLDGTPAVGDKVSQEMFLDSDFGVPKKVASGEVDAVTVVDSSVTTVTVSVYWGVFVVGNPVVIDGKDYGSPTKAEYVRECEQPATTKMTVTAGASSVADSRTWTLSAFDNDGQARTSGVEGTDVVGNFVVCLCSLTSSEAEGFPEPDASTCDAARGWHPIPASSGAHLFRVDAVPKTGELFATDNRASVRAGQAGSFTLHGRDLRAQGTLKVVDVSNDSPAACTGTRIAGDNGDLEYDLSGATLSSDQSSLTVTEFDSAGVSSGKYGLCVGNTRVGNLWVTTRVDVGHYYVFDGNLTVGGSLEVVGTRLSAADRILIQDCNEPCGLADLAPSVVAPSGGFVGATQFAPIGFAPTIADSKSSDIDQAEDRFSEVHSRYCFGHTLPMASLATADRNLQCHTQCSGGSTAAACAGYLPGVDTATSPWLCAARAECRRICELHDDCYSISVATHEPRCRLHTAGCSDQVAQGTLSVDSGFDVLIRREWRTSVQTTYTTETTTVTQLNVTVEPMNLTTRRLQEIAAVGVDDGFSTPSVLRFHPVRFSSPGKYRVCFCDRELLTPDRTYDHCSAQSDFVVDIGEIVVTGVSCVLAQPSLRRKTCQPMWYGGLLCNSDPLSPLPDLPPLSAKDQGLREPGQCPAAI